MKKVVFVLALVIVFVISGCGEISSKNDGLPGDAPPNVNIELGGESYETTLGSYCWASSNGESECIDTAGPVDLLEDKDPISIEPGAEIHLNMDYTPKPSKVHLSQMSNDVEMEIEVNDDQFTAPDNKGVYFYSYGAWWTDEEEEDVSHGSAFYAFAIEVQ